MSHGVVGRLCLCSEIALVGVERADVFVDRDSGRRQRHVLEAIEMPLVRAGTGAPYNLAGPAGAPRFLHRQALIACQRPILGESLVQRHARALPLGRSP